MWLQQLWTENQWSTFADFLQRYNDLDVTPMIQPMIQPIENMNDFYKNICIDFIHQAISLPGVAMRVCFNSITDPAAEFHLFNSKNKEIYQLFKENIVGGLSIIFNRYHEAGKTVIRNNPNKPCQKVTGYDANALYLWAIGQNSPAGYPLIHCQEKYFMHEFPQFAAGCSDWIDWLIQERNIVIQSAFHGGERKIGSYRVDCFCSELDTVFEFYGDYWHAHPDQFPNENALHPTIKDKDGNPLTVKDIRTRDQHCVQDLRDKGYNVEIMWEKDWQALLTQRPEIKTYLAQHHTFTHFKKDLSQDQIIKYIQGGHLFGFVECNIEVPDHLKEYFLEMTPIFKNDYYFTHADQLDEITLPPYGTFYSTIKGCNILEEEHTTFQKLIDQGKSEQEALQILRLTSKLKTGPKNYMWLQQLWTENQWSTFADFLEWYNDLDVTPMIQPMIQPIENMNDFYKNICIDFIHQAISLPGVAMRVCFNSITDPAAEFHLFNSKNKEIYQLFKENIVGGLSIIFNRYHEAGKTVIRNNPNKPCQKVTGYDANALYLWAIGQNFPAGYPLIHCQEKYFMHEFPQFAAGCSDWIDWLIQERNIVIQSAFHGGERKIGSYRVDCFCSELDTVFEFYGDYWHAHPDQFPDENALHPTIKDKDGNPLTVKDIRTRDQHCVQDLRDKGYNVEIMWEKDWQALLTQRPEIKTYLAQHHTFTHFKKDLSQDQIIKYIQDGHLFGFVECNIEVPDHLKEYFLEMTPIFKNVEVCLDDVGEFMQEYAKQQNITDVPRRLLNGSYFGKKIGISSPLLNGI